MFMGRLHFWRQHLAMDTDYCKVETYIQGGVHLLQ